MIALFRHAPCFLRNMIRDKKFSDPFSRKKIHTKELEAFTEILPKNNFARFAHYGPSQDFPENLALSVNEV